MTRTRRLSRSSRPCSRMNPNPTRKTVTGPGWARPAYIVNPTMNYQGFLTDSGGSPVNDTLDFTASLWDEEGAGVGVQLWGPEVHKQRGCGQRPVQPSAGLEHGPGPRTISTTRCIWRSKWTARCCPASRCGGVPYALTLAPGAYIRGENDVDPTLYVRQDGEEFALWAQENGATVDYGLGADKIYAGEGYASGADSFLWVPGSLAYSPATGVTLDPQHSGILLAECDVTGFKQIYVPIAITSRLYGHNVVVEEVRVYYYTTNASSPINQSRLRKLEADGGVDIIAENMNDPGLNHLHFLCRTH